MTQEAIIFDDTWNPLTKKAIPLQSKVEVSDLALAAVRDFDYQTDGLTEFYPYELPVLPKNFKIGVIVGASGTGKSTLLSEFGQMSRYEWDARAIVDHFETPEEAKERLFAVGLTSIPNWLKPYSVLSNGEKFRADLAIKMKNNQIIDEYTSVVDRNIAKAASKSLSKYVQSNDIKGIVIATVHRDVLEYLEPDWIIDTDAGMYCLKPRECLWRESLVADVYEVRATAWQFFSKYHYLTAELSPFARCFVAIINGSPVAFESIISYPSGTVQNAFREHRLVTHPDYQGLGIGPRFSDYIANWYFMAGKRVFSKTAHPRLGEYREKSREWKPTSKNKRYRTDAARDQERQIRQNRFTAWKLNPDRMTYSHEYIGRQQEGEEE